MAEPPAKRSRRTDSKEMWERGEPPSRGPERDSRDDNRRRYDRDRTYRSRSRERTERRRDRSRSRERNRGSDRERLPPRERDRRDGRDTGRYGDRDDREELNGGERARERSRTRLRPGGRRGDSFLRRSINVGRGTDLDADDVRSPRRKSGTRSRSPRRERARSRTPPRKAPGNRKDEPMKSVEPTTDTPPAFPDSMEVTSGRDGDAGEEEEDDGIDPEMKAMMGFGGFGTTKQKKIAGNDTYAVRKEKKTEYRQYMNRLGGFNRPLSPS
ncbi:MAG: hypothetical protein M4579_000198 [Chaenotheca gracillima]|nr:MAG: hypothetical protein M4579_000198 [Chaenotheca gracillima]